MRVATLIVNAGNHGRRWCAVETDVEIPPDVKDGGLVLRDETNGRLVPHQLWSEQGRSVIGWIIDDLPPKMERRYDLISLDRPVPPLADGVSVAERDGVLDIRIGGSPFISYNYGPSVVRPYFYPLYAEEDRAVTRNWPMVKDVPGETADHPHHKGLYTAHGEVNGVDNWAEGEGHGYQIHVGFDEIFSGPVAGGFTERLQWTDKDRRPNMAETRKITVYGTQQGLRIVDYEVTLSAEFGDVTLGDTKEGGLLSVRVATSMDAARGDGGRILNAFGGTGEEETWGKRAPWCDYSGPIGDSWYGICMMDHPDNPRHPTHWHVRDYGLMTANCFGIHDFTANPENRRDMVLAAGGSAAWRYRLLVHAGVAGVEELTRSYQNFANPPRIRTE